MPAASVVENGLR